MRRTTSLLQPMLRVRRDQNRFAFLFAVKWILTFVFALGVVGYEASAYADDGSSDAGAAPKPGVLSAPSASSRAPQVGEVHVRDKVLIILRAARGGVSAPERARAANAALDALVAQTEEIGEARFEETPETAVIYVGNTPIVTLGTEDVEGSGEASLNVLAAQTTARLARAVSTERKRSAIATTVFSFSLLIFSGLLAFLLLNRVSEGAQRIQNSIRENPEKVTELRLGKVEFVSAGALRSLLSVGLSLGYRFLQIAIAYGWLIFALSLFESTRGYTERLTGMVLGPLYGLAARVGGALPLVVVATIQLFAVLVLLRFVALFFESVARGDTRAGWLSRDLARPTSVLVQFGIIVLSLVLASPLMTGENDGVISRVGLAALFAVSLAATPLLASAVVGSLVVFGRYVRRGDDIEIGAYRGKVTEITLVDLCIEDESLSEVRIPHLLRLVRPTRIHKHAPLTTLEIVVDPNAAQDDVERVLFEAARGQSSRGRVELVYMDEEGAHWRITSASVRHDRTLARAVQDALGTLGVRFGRGRRKGPSVRSENT